MRSRGVVGMQPEPASTGKALMVEVFCKDESMQFQHGDEIDEQLCNSITGWFSWPKACTLTSID